jgi:hypothetical protein
MSDDPKAPHVYTAILAVMHDLGVEGISKDRTNKTQNFKFRGIEDVINALTPLLVKHQLLILPRFTTHKATSHESKQAGYLNDVYVTGEFDLVSALDGSKHTIAAHGQGMDSSDKATNKAMSGAFKYASIFAFCVPTKGVIDDGDDDDDDDEGGGRREPETTRERERDPAPRRDRRDIDDQRRHPRDEDDETERDAPRRPAVKEKGDPEKIELTEIPAGEEDQEITWRVENVWPILLGDVDAARSERPLKAAFTRAYRWAQALPMEGVSRNLLVGITDRYNKRKKDMGIK